MPPRSDETDEWTLTVGVLVAPFGIAGEAKIRIETDFPERFASLKKAALRLPDGTLRMMKVERSRMHKEQALLKFEGIDRIEDVDPLRGALVQVRRADAVPLSGDDFYIHDAIGCRVETAEGRELGSVTSILRAGANDVLVVSDGKVEVMLPLVRDVVKRVDIANRHILVTPTEGLLPDVDAEPPKRVPKRRPDAEPG